MIRLADAQEKKDITEMLTSQALRDIIPDRLSGKDSRNFWDDVFGSNSQNEGSEITEDDIWAEIFGRDENEFLFDFEIGESLCNILDKLDSVKWDTLTEDERIDIIQQFVHVLADRLELDTTPEIAFFDGEATSLGAFSPAGNQIEINSDLLEHPEMLRNVIPHEMRHAYQHQRADAQETWMDFLYLINFNNYITPVRLGDNTCLYYTDYHDQLVEAEARAFAKLFS